MSKSEFQLIEAYFSDPTPVSRDDVILGIGDDCAIVAPRKQSQLAVSIDTLISGVHFPHNTSPDAIAYKALAVNLSDLAAMGADPAWFTLSLSLPETLPSFSREAWLAQFSSALFSLAQQYNIQLIGGDTTKGSLSITIQVTGYLPPDAQMKRAGAQVDDLIVLTGVLGAAAIGLDIALQQNESSYACLSEAEKASALKALNYPIPRVEEGLSLQGIAHAALDLSDGLLSDLGHILTASHVGAEISLEKIPLATSLGCLDKNTAWEKALTGGDDYELCFTIAAADWPELENKYPHFTVIGLICAEQGLRLLDQEKEIKLSIRGYDHFG
ncbi:thiamine-phosphate kinase [sulfur-oxidizing endosymbiont of Gigantopelta aegis]|uniref:thiamine-phosphate kinase n=1 Tax=sulfur-oxidizing endosymbiont of Gigantopelta aegis TaxID=2794934 RepID=UPI0018DE90DC|nr:thiamine-phosphate kinase [sulfur-oxidizing endosymbiont of Gigantopelta aegis]